MFQDVTLPLWLFVLILGFAAITFASHFLFPSVRWFFRRRMERAVARLNDRLERPIQPFKLLERQDTILRLSYDREVMAAVRAYAAEEGLREDVAFQRAKTYAREIVPSFSAFAYFGFAIRAARWLSNALYRVRLGRHDADALAAVDPDATVVFVMNHRSNMDYVLVTWLAAERSALSYAVGEWARVWPLSRLIKAMGAYFIRRKERDALYRTVLRRYVQIASENGVTQAIFPEGGLSLDGRLAPPKLGLLSYIVEGVDITKRDVVFVPVALNYDRVLEDTVLVRAGQAGTRRFDARITSVARAALKQLWLRVTGRFHRFGYAAVSFGTPISLRDMAHDPEQLGDKIMQGIADIVPLLPVPTIAHLLRQGASDRLTLIARYADIAMKEKQTHVHLPRQDVSYAVEVGLRALKERGWVTEDGQVIEITENGAPFIDYYANSVASLLTEPDAIAPKGTAAT